MNGHGGENFFKIRDTELLHSEDFAKVLDEMHLKGLYKEMFLMLDTCEALSMFDNITAPNLHLLSTSRHNESALADITDGELNTFLADKFSAHLSDFLFMPNGYQHHKEFTLADFTPYFSFDTIKSHV